MFAMIRVGNRQFKVKAGDFVRVPFQDKPASSQIEIPVLAFISDGDMNYKPSELKDSKLKAEVVRQTLGKKILVFKKKRRKGYRKTRGFRPKTTELRILEIQSPDGKVFKALERKPPKKTKEEKISAKKAIKAAPKKQIQGKVKATEKSKNKRSTIRKHIQVKITAEENKKGDDFTYSISSSSKDPNDLKKKELHKPKKNALGNEDPQDWKPLLSSELPKQEEEAGKTSAQLKPSKTEPEKPSPLNKKSAKKVLNKKKAEDEHPTKPAKVEGEADKDKSDKKGPDQTEKKPPSSEKRKSFLTEQSRKFFKKPLLWAKKKTGRRSGR